MWATWEKLFVLEFGRVHDAICLNEDASYADVKQSGNNKDLQLYFILTLIFFHNRRIVCLRPNTALLYMSKNLSIILSDCTTYL